MSNIDNNSLIQQMFIAHLLSHTYYLIKISVFTATFEVDDINLFFFFLNR